MAARFVDQPGERRLAMAEILDQPLIGLGFFDRVQIFALDILDQRNFERFGFVEIAHDHRDLVELRALRRPPAPFAGDDLKMRALRPHDDRLDHPARFNRPGELAQRLIVEMAARLVGMRRNLADRQQLDSRFIGRCVDRGFFLDFAHQRGQAAAQTAGLLLCWGFFAFLGLAHSLYLSAAIQAAWAVLGSLAMVSRASAI